MSNYSATKQHVSNKGVAPDDFLDELVAWGEQSCDEIFAPNAGRNTYDIYSSVLDELGPWQGVPHRRAVMLEVMRVLAGFESSWNWNEGRDTRKRRSVNTKFTAGCVGMRLQSFKRWFKARPCHR